MRQPSSKRPAGSTPNSDDVEYATRALHDRAVAFLGDDALLARAVATYCAVLKLEEHRLSGMSARQHHVAMETWFRAFCEREHLPVEFAAWMLESGRRGVVRMSGDEPAFRSSVGARVHRHAASPMASITFGPFATPASITAQVREVRRTAGWPSPRAIRKVAPSRFDADLAHAYRFELLLGWLALARDLEASPGDSDELEHRREALTRRACLMRVTLKGGALRRQYGDAASVSELVRRFRAMHRSHRRLSPASLRTSLFRSEPFARLLREYEGRI